MDKTFTELREEYTRQQLLEDAVESDPIAQFRRWFDEAVSAGVPLANGMTLATCDRDGQPTARVVLLKAYDAHGFVFFTNYDSDKGRDLQANPRASLSFWWTPLERQVRIDGEVERVSSAESDDYFATRPRASNLSAMASQQSRIVPGRPALERAVVDLDQALSGQPLTRPDNWGGYRLIPRRIEFWQGRADRLHDRLRFSRDADGWKLDRLAP